MTDLPPNTEVQKIEGQQARSPTKYEQYKAAIKTFILRQYVAFKRFVRRAKRHAAQHKKKPHGYPGNYLRFTLAACYADRRNILRNALGIGWWNVNRGQLLFAGILTVATIAGWIAMLVQNNIMREQMEQTDKTLALMENQQRAWLVTSNPGFIEIKEGDISVSADLINLGGASAFVRHYEVDAYFGSPRQSILIDERRILAHAINAPFWEKELKPGEKIPIAAEFVSGAKPEDVAAFDKGNAWFYIVFSYIYDDPLRQNVTYHVAFARSSNVPGFVPWPIEGNGENDRN